MKAACGHDQPIKRRVIGKTSPVALNAGGTKNKQKKGKGEAKACGTKVTKGTSKAKVKAKAIEDVKPKAKAKATMTKTPPPTESKPALDLENTVYYGGGRLYAYPKRKLFRVWLRTGDKKDKGVNYGKDPTPAHLKKRWNDALKLIQDDPRSVDVD